LAVAALAAISYAGFDITSLAIVAGALSVGIGFGLQSIVNNFVSGLILLVERPIKVGDWISIKEGEGYVRRIAVRSTEIETFGRASLIVPNSELITQTVVNLTHRNLLGRLKVRVRVSYQADPEHALKVLQQVAEANTSILRHPPPVVVLDNLGEQALEYSVRVYLADINRSLQAQTELRTAILKALRAEGIDIPYASALAGHAHGPAPTAGRATVTIGVSHDCDPEAVQAALSEAARRSGLKIDGEGAEVAFEDIDDNALNFSVSVPLTDGVSTGEAETALRTQAVKTLRERGINLASPQRQVRLRDLEGLRTFLARLAEERARRSDAEADDAVQAPPRKPDND
jgi:small-conductance mechanosensitive channel